MVGLASVVVVYKSSASNARENIAEGGYSSRAWMAEERVQKGYSNVEDVPFNCRSRALPLRDR